MLIVVALQEAYARTIASGVEPDHVADFAQVMVEMRDQGLDPYSHPMTLVLRPYRSAVGRGGHTVKRFIFRIEGSDPIVEFGVDLLPGLLPEEQWTAARSATWRRTRDGL